MTDIIDFNKYKEDRTPHYEGAVVCTHCHHEWHAVAPEGSSGMKCPTCGLEKGVWANHMGSFENAEWFKCVPCGGFFFNMLRTPDHGEYFMCCNCGQRIQR